jgi:AGZA family xanthine/uracil permease-like MFS transporter
MMAVVRDIAWDDYEEAIPAFVTMLAMPFTWSITNGIGAGVVTWTAIKVLGGQRARVPPMLYAATGAFLLYFALRSFEGGTP